MKMPVQLLSVYLKRAFEKFTESWRQNAPILTLNPFLNQSKANG